MNSYNVVDLQKILYNKLISSNHPEANYRYKHSLGVLEASLDLVERYQLPISKEKLQLAALLHDYAKFEPIERYREINERYKLGIDVDAISFNVLHGFFAPYVLMEELCIVDIDVLDAVRYHATGHPSMNLLAEIIYLADYIEPTRKGIYFEEARDIAAISYKSAIAYTAKSIIVFLENTNQPIHPYTRAVYEAYQRFERKEEANTINV